MTIRLFIRENAVSRNYYFNQDFITIGSNQSTADLILKNYQISGFFLKLNALTSDILVENLSDKKWRGQFLNILGKIYFYQD